MSGFVFVKAAAAKCAESNKVIRGKTIKTARRKAAGGGNRKLKNWQNLICQQQQAI